MSSKEQLKEELDALREECNAIPELIEKMEKRLRELRGGFHSGGLIGQKQAEYDRAVLKEEHEKLAAPVWVESPLAWRRSDDDKDYRVLKVTLKQIYLVVAGGAAHFVYRKATGKTLGEYDGDGVLDVDATILAWESSKK